MSILRLVMSTIIYHVLSCHTLYAAKFKVHEPNHQSILFVSLNSGKIIYEHNPDLLLSPASVSKLFTAGVALNLFSPQFRFETKVYYTGLKKGGEISGDITIVGAGDPFIVSENLWQFAADLKHMGIKTIKGNLVIDGSLFTDNSWDSSRRSAIKSSRNAYNAPITALAVNFNTFPIAIAPAYQMSQKALVSIDPYPISSIKIINKTTTITGSRNYAKAERKNKGDSEVIHTTGKVGLNGALKKIYRSVSHPLLISGEQIYAFLKNEGIVIEGSVKIQSKSKDAKELYTIKGYPLSRIVTGLNKYSNNYIADTLVKDFGAYHSTSHQGDMKSGLTKMHQVLQHEFNVRGALKLYNGSGLNPRNRASASQVVQLLKVIAKNMILFPEFLNSLPSSGKDGSLKDRFSRTELHHLHGHIRAKTGTLTTPVSVSSLSGYMMHPTHGLVAFAIIDNGVESKTQPSIIDLQYRQENIIERIYRLK